MAFFENASNSALSKFGRGISKDHESHTQTTGPRISAAEVDCLMDASDLGSATNVMKGLVQRDLEKKAVAEAEDANQFMEAAAAAHEEKKAIDKERSDQKKKDLALRPMDAAVERLGLANAIQVADSNFGHSIMTLQRQQGTIQARATDLVKDIGNADFDAELLGKVEPLEEALKALADKHEAVMEEFKTFHKSDPLKSGIEYNAKVIELKDKVKFAHKMDEHAAVVTKMKELTSYKESMNKKLSYLIGICRL